MDFLLDDLLKIQTSDHSKIQAWIKRYFYDLGYYSRTEREVWRDRKGRIDVFAQKGSYTVGVEVDHCQFNGYLPMAELSCKIEMREISKIKK